MLKGIYTSAYGMFTRMSQHSTISNNLANVNTPGYKKDRMIFQSLLQEGSKDNIMENLNDQDVEVLAIYTNYENGPLSETSNPFDTAIQGDGFFTVQTPQGERYTRAGHFTLNQENVLVDMNGNPVMGYGGEIVITGNNVNIAKDGSIVSNDEVIDSLRMVNFPQPERLLKEGKTYYKLNENQEIYEMLPEEINLASGFIENSNVSAVREMVNMIEAMRYYETNQKAIQVQDATLDKLINEVARA